MSEETENVFQVAIDAITQKYKPRFDEIAKKGGEIEGDYKTPSDVGVVVGVDITVDWKDIAIVFDLPSVELNDKRIAFDLPEINKSRQKIAFDVPSTRTVLKKVGQYPEMHGWKVVWKDILIEIPEFYMKRVDIVYDLPSVTMKRKEIVLGIPQFSMQRQEWIIRLPQFTVVKISAQTEEIKKKGEALQSEAKELEKLMTQEIQAEAAKLTGSLVAAAFSSKNDAGNAYNGALGTIKTAIEDLQAQGCDPIKVPTENGDVNLRKVYDTIEADRSRAIAEIDQGISSIK